MKKNESVINMTKGAVLPLLVRFMIPIMLTNLLQTFYGMVDSAVVGNFNGPNALGAIGATSSLTNLILALFIGISTGAGIIVAQRIGAEDDRGVNLAVHTSFAFALAGGVFLMIFGGIFSGKILRLMSTPEEIYPLANIYMTIYFMGAVPSLVYNFGAGILRAVGDSKRPLYYLACATVVNITFNLIFVIVFDLGVAGVAISTVMSQTVSAFLVVRQLVKSEDCIKLNIREIKFHKRMFINILKIGVPSGIQSSVFSFSNTIIQSTINSFGSAAVSGCAASAQIESFQYMIMKSISLASTTFISQNYGAGKFKRCSEGMKKSFVLITAVGLVLGAFMMTFRFELLKIFTADAVSLNYGSQRIVIFAATYFLCGIMEILSGTICGYGDAFSPMLITLIGVTGSRMLWIFAVLPFRRAISTVYMAFPVSWSITIIALSIRYIMYRKHLKVRREKAFSE